MLLFGVGFGQPPHELLARGVDHLSIIASVGRQLAMMDQQQLNADLIDLDASKSLAGALTAPPTASSTR